MLLFEDKSFAIELEKVHVLTLKCHPFLTVVSKHSQTKYVLWWSQVTPELKIYWDSGDIHDS